MTYDTFLQQLQQIRPAAVVLGEQQEDRYHLYTEWDAEARGEIKSVPPNILALCSTAFTTADVLAQLQPLSAVDGRRWRCGRCGYVRSVRDGSFFSGSHLSLLQIIQIMFLWADDTQQDEMMHHTHINRRETMVDWCNF